MWEKRLPPLRKPLMLPFQFSPPCPAQVPTVAAALPPAFVPRVLTLLSEMLAASPHLEFMLNWVSVKMMEKCGTAECGSTG